MRNRVINAIIVIVAVVNATVSAQAYVIPVSEFEGAKEISFSEFSRLADEKALTTVNLTRGNTVFGVAKSGDKFTVRVPYQSMIFDKLVAAGVDVKVVTLRHSDEPYERNPLAEFLQEYFPTLVFLAILVALLMFYLFLSRRALGKHYQKEDARMDEFFDRLDKLLDQYAK